MLKYGDYVAHKHDLHVKGFIVRTKEKGKAQLSFPRFDGESFTVTGTESFDLATAHFTFTPVPLPLEKELKHD